MSYAIKTTRGQKDRQGGGYLIKRKKLKQGTVLFKWSPNINRLSAKYSQKSTKTPQFQSLKICQNLDRSKVKTYVR